MPIILPIKKLWFPPAKLASKEGLLAVGGDLSAERLLLAYRSGIFPWFDQGNPILWWSPNPRFVLFPGKLKIRRSLRKLLRQNKFEVRFDTCFGEVISACSHIPREDQQGTWITPGMLSAYNQLFDLGWAHSIEIFYADQLVGGLYGIAMGPFFFGESMFHTASDASKVALAALVHRYRKGVLIDCQVENDFFFSMGAQYIARSQFLDLLQTHLKDPDLWKTGLAITNTATLLDEKRKT